MRRHEDIEPTPRRQQTMTRRTILEAKKCFQDHKILSIDFVPDLSAYFCVLWFLVFNQFFDVLLGQRSKPGSHVFASSLTDGRPGNTKRANLTWLPSEIMHRGHTLLTGDGDLECPCLVLERLLHNLQLPVLPVENRCLARNSSVKIELQDNYPIMTSPEELSGKTAVLCAEGYLESSQIQDADSNTFMGIRDM